jgi:hypothetical protein
MVKQAEKELSFICAYTDCVKETTIIVKVSKALPTQSKGVKKAYYCQHCNRSNKIPIPDNLDEHNWVLGRDKGFLRYTSDDIPLLQGEKDV